jgi:ATP-dependent DNA helicase UvrD/PcrA
VTTTTTRARSPIAPKLLGAYPNLDAAKHEIIAHHDGPLLVIAGPGSGKTFSLVLRTINLLLLERAKPSEIIVCTFTEKAAFELRDRISQTARKVGYTADLSELRVATIHSICNQILREFRHRTPLGAGCSEMRSFGTSCMNSHVCSPRTGSSPASMLLANTSRCHECRG